jgi:hypothetical protein
MVGLTWLIAVLPYRTRAPGRGNPQGTSRPGSPASAASLATDLQLAREQIKQLRNERDKLREHIRLQLGQQLEEIPSKT